ncbi:hypothetical protein Slin15195_G087090 [Septoria linicola]|uniref:Uncharacterized protein n=1 Tax=Septoria linicola TaxID=215465 RepID=A0A9Q9AZI3_9PEZI|nr:hypothetical protein Slin14017_G089680 [Septoria linicola]USW55390.1 hypothetical protein Slin15195_G087090 [Septoria linicola]
MEMQRSAGSTYILTLNKKKWPIVICRDELAPEEFIRLRHRQSHTAAVLLGKRKFIWVNPETLEDIEPHKDYTAGLTPFAQQDIQDNDSDEVIDEKRRRLAFRDDAQQWKDDAFWANYIFNQSEARKFEWAGKKHQSSSHKRRRNTKSDSVIALEDNGARSDWSTPAKRSKRNDSRSLLSLRTPRTLSKSHGQCRHDSAIDPIEISDGNSDDDDFDGELFVSSSRNKGKKPARFTNNANDIHDSIEFDDPFVSKSKAATPGPNQCKLLFPKSPALIVDKATIANCQFLFSRRCDDEHATELDLTNDQRAKATNLSADDINAVISYFRHHELGPRLINKPDEPPTVSQIDHTTRKKEAHAEALIKAFVTAMKIEDETLQELIHSKFIALHPLAPISALIVARSVASLPEPTTEAHKNIMTWATDHLAQCFWALARDCGELLQGLLQENEAMRTAVYDALKADPQARKLGFDG